jgi:DHA1 family tetracycline resistance protein-like MFS transporter
VHGARSERSKERKPLPPGFGSLWSTVVLDLVGFGIILPILPLYTEDLGARGVVLGVVLAAYSLAQLVGAPYLGRLSDRHGRRLVLVVALCGSALGHLLTGLAGTVWLVLAARALDGFSGGSLSIAHAAASDLAEPEDRPRLFGLLGAGIAVGFVLGPALGALATLGGKHIPFFVAAALCAANAATAWWRLPDIRPAAPSGERGAPGAGALGGASTLRAAGRTAVATLTQGGALSRVLWASFVGAIGFGAFEATFSLLGRRRVDLGPGNAGLVFAAVGVVLAVVQGLVVSRVIERRGERATGRLALAIQIVAFALLVPAGGWMLLMAGVVGLTIGQGLLGPSLSTMVAGLADPAHRGAAFGAQQSISAAARVVGPLVGSTLFAIGAPLPFVVGAGLCAASLLLLR